MFKIVITFVLHLHYLGTNKLKSILINTFGEVTKKKKKKSKKFNYSKKKKEHRSIP